MISDLERRASEARALNRTLKVRCPAPQHGHAVQNVPCFPPSAERPRGWVCIARHEAEITRRAEVDERSRREANIERERLRAERREWKASRVRALNAADIAAASGLNPREAHRGTD